MLDEKDARAIQELLGYRFSNLALLEQALTHPSASLTRKDTTNYERLEFLGDSLLSAYVALSLFERFSDAREGELTQMKSSVVSGRSLAHAAHELGISDYIIFSNHTKEQNSRVIARVLEDVYEALVGAIYLDRGAAPMADFIDRTLASKIARPPLASSSPKAELQEYAQAKVHMTPHYSVLEKAGEDHAPSFYVQVTVDTLGEARAWGANKKEAEAKAAQRLLETLEEAKER